MVIPIFWTERGSIPNIDILLSNVQQRGGSIVQYEHVFSFVLYTRVSTHFDWVPPNTSRTRAALKHVAFCLAFGWWSVPGFIRTGGAIINNLMGGIDVTRILISPPGHSYDESALKELAAAEKRQQYGILVFILFLIVCVLISVRSYL